MIRSEESPGDYNFGDSPERNSMYQMLKELSESLKDCDDFRPEDFIHSWNDFCRIARHAYETHKNT